MKLALDHHYSPLIAAKLCSKSFDVVTAVERGWHAEEDNALLSLCHAEQRALLTNNVGDFAVIARPWLAEGRSHSGLIFTSDTSLPRSRSTVGRYVQLLTEVFVANTANDALTNRILWL